jgi:hypothetical protein
MNIPDIRLRSSFLLNDAVIPLLLPGLRESGHEKAADSRFINSKVDAYNEVWKPYETQILTAMCEILGIEFRQNIIDAYVLPFHNSFSDPMVISTKYDSDRFVEIFTHELSHRLLTDNKKLSDGRDDVLLKMWSGLFGDEHSIVTLIHIPVHAMLEYIFTDILDEPLRLERDIKMNQNYSDYALAWSYVKENNYQKILSDLRTMYISL